MITQLTDPPIAEQPAEIDERRWLEWVVKGRELDRRGAAKRFKFILMVLAVGGVTLAAATLYRFLR